MSFVGGKAIMLDNGESCAIVALTSQGKKTALKLKKGLKEDIPIYVLSKISDEQTIAIEGLVTQMLARLFKEVDVLICIMATGIVIRSIAPVVFDKTSDPAVIVLDEKAQNVISLLSGHLGGANKWTKKIASILKANPVITTATDVQNVIALDILAKMVNGWREELRPLVKEFNSYLSQGKRVYFYQEKNWLEDFRGLTVIDARQLEDILQSQETLIYLACREIAIFRSHLAVIYPKTYILGVGTRKNVDNAIFREAFAIFCKKEKVSPSEIARIVSIDLKKEEPAILDLAKYLSVPFITYSKDELSMVADKYPQSSFVRQMVGVGSVAMASADLASGGRVVTERFALNGCTFALAKIGMETE